MGTKYLILKQKVADRSLTHMEIVTYKEHGFIPNIDALDKGTCLWIHKIERSTLKFRQWPRGEAEPNCKRTRVPEKSRKISETRVDLKGSDCQ